MTVIPEQKVEVRGYARTPTNRSNKYYKTKPDGTIGVNMDNDRNDQKYPLGPMPIRLVRAMLPGNLHPRIERIIYWRNVRKSFVYFLSGIIMFAAISYYGLVSVVCYLSLAFLTSTFILRLCGLVLRKNFLDSNWSNKEAFDELVLRTCVLFFHFASDIRDIVFVKSLVHTLKVFIILLFWTYVGEMMNGYTLIVSFFILSFIIPKSCELLILKLSKKSPKGKRDIKAEIPTADNAQVDSA